VNFLPRQVALVSVADSDASFPESTLSSFGLQIARYDSIAALTREVQQQLASKGDGGGDPAKPELAIVAGPTTTIAGDDDQPLQALARLLPVLVTSSASSVADAVTLMKQGAADVIPLPCQREELWDRVRQSLEAVDARRAHQAQAAVMRARLNLLTPAEQTVVDAMLDGLANKQIAQRLGIGLRTVELRRSKIMRKMQAKSVAQLVKFICLAGGVKAKGPGEAAEGS